MLKRHPSQYKRVVRCPTCKSDDVVSVEHLHRAQMRKRAESGMLCKCTAYPFPHERGSLRMCDHHTLADVDPSEDEWRDYEACLATPRSAWV